MSRRPVARAAPGQNRVSARIADVTYLGEDLHLSLDLAGGERLRAAREERQRGARPGRRRKCRDRRRRRATCGSCAAERRGRGARAGPRPVWALLTGPYALFLLFLLLVPFANIAMYSMHPYSPTKVFLPELTFDNYRKIFDLYYLRLFGRTLRLGLITTASASCSATRSPISWPGRGRGGRRSGCSC